MPDDIRQAFLGEARELAEQLMLGVLHAERSRALPADERRRLLRLAHTLKGAARLVKEQAIGDAAHAMEELIASAADTFDASTVARLLGLIDEVNAALPQGEGPTSRAGGAVTTPDDTRSVRVDLHGINGALERVADLASRVAALQGDLAGIAPQARTAADRIALSLADLRTELHHMRLAPARTLFATAERAVRDAAQASDVLVSFTADGGDQRLDADVLDTLRDALIQLARNAVAHGIEPPRQRAAAGKPLQGHVTLTVESRGPSVAFIVTDDGRGLDLDTLRRAAAARGLGGDLTEEALVERLLAGGLTSRPVATQLAGRGVGLDLVRSVVARLDGALSLRHEPGRGVSVEIVVPASMRSLRYIRLESGACAALLPLDALTRTIRLADHATVVIDGRIHLMIENQAVPMITLTRVLAGDPSVPEGVAAVVATGRGHLALAAERFRDTAQTVAEALPPLSGASAVVRDIALGPDGSIVPVLEPRALTLALAEQVSRTPVRREPLLLVVDDSVTSRMLEQSILEAAGFKVDTAGSAEEALRAAAQTSYDLFIVDVEMPGMNGYEFVRTTRASETTSRIPAILVTSRGSEADRQRGADAGAHGYIVKSEFNQDVFLDLVRRLVG